MTGVADYHFVGDTHDFSMLWTKKSPTTEVARHGRVEADLRVILNYITWYSVRSGKQLILELCRLDVGLDQIDYHLVFLWLAYIAVQ